MAYTKDSYLCNNSYEAYFLFGRLKYVEPVANPRYYIEVPWVFRKGKYGIRAT